MNKGLPVLNSAGRRVGYAASVAHRKAAQLANSGSVRQEFRPVDGRRRLCWIPA